MENQGSSFETELLVQECKIQIDKLLADTANVNEMLLNSVESGLIDPPFAPHRACRGKLKTLRALDGSVRITSDRPGEFTKHFIDHETFKLGNKKFWGNVTSDDVKGDIQYPFREEQGLK
jgi:glutamate mutase epsilon subunit